jgi:prevent-host-death family protein
MKTATVRELRNHYTSLLRWLRAGEQIVITQRGRPIARLVPENSAKPSRVKWAAAPEVRRDRSKEQRLNARAVAQLLAESSSSW